MSRPMLPRLRVEESAVTAPLVLVESGRAPEQATIFSVARTADALMISFEAEDREPWATLTERDAPLYTEEVVEVFLDPVGDLSGYFEIEVNPLGAVLDLLVRRNWRGLLKDKRWHCEGLRQEVARTERGWSAQLAIPWSAVATGPPESGAIWRANFARIDRPQGKPRELSAWSPTGVELFHVPERFGYLEF